MNEKQKTVNSQLLKEEYFKIHRKKSALKSGQSFFSKLLKNCHEKDIVRYEYQYFNYGIELERLEKLETQLLDKLLPSQK